MTPTSTRPSSRGPAPPYVDDNPFIEPSVPVAVAIPLPLSPSSSLVVDSTASVKDQPASRTSPRSPGATSYATAPTNQTLNTPTPSLAPLPDPVVSRTPRHKASDSIHSNHTPAAALSPPMFHSTGSVRSPVARPTSPSGLSDTMSLVSAAPSRNWTDGGTADIFSGSEHDFRDQDSDEDVRSVSDSGSWEDVSAAGGVGSPPVAPAGRLSGR